MSTAGVSYLILLCSGYLYIIIHAEDNKSIQTSINDMAKLLTTINQMYEQTERLANVYDEKLKHISGVLAELKNIQMDKKINILNPILLVKASLTINRALENKQYNTKSSVTVNNEDVTTLTLTTLTPNTLNVDEQMRILLELQDFYDLDTQRIAEGILNELAVNISLSAIDCYEIGSWALQNRDGYHAKLWLTEAKRRLLSKPFEKTVLMKDILFKLAEVYSVYNDVETSNQLIEEVLRLDPLNQRALQLQLVLRGDSKPLFDVFLSLYSNLPRRYDWSRSTNSTFIQQLCHHTELVQQEFLTFCSYYHTIYKCLPIKTEALRIEPPVGIVHEIITNKEINAFQQQADLLNRGKAARNHSTLLKAPWNNVIKNFIRKIKSLTSPSVVLGSVSHIHFDVAEFHKLSYKPIKISKKFANVNKKGFNLMVFLNNPDGGGNLIFPWLNLSIVPKRGSAVIWEFPEGKSDKRLLHTVCPLYAGNFTVVHVRGYKIENQEMRRTYF